MVSAHDHQVQHHQQHHQLHQHQQPQQQAWGHDSNGHHQLPFASDAYAHAAQPAGGGEAAGPGASPALSGVCILRQAEGERRLALDGNLLQQAGLKTRMSATSVPDVIITSPLLPAPLVCIIAGSTDPRGSLEDAAFMDRCASMAGTFRTSWLVLPYVLGSHPVVLDLVCDARYRRILLHHYVPGQDLAAVVMQLLSCCSDSPEARQLAADARHELVAAVTHPDAVDAALAALTGATTPCAAA